jgi:hypothetical protein
VSYEQRFIDWFQMAHFYPSGLDLLHQRFSFIGR